MENLQNRDNSCIIGRLTRKLDGIDVSFQFAIDKEHISHGLFNFKTEDMGKIDDYLHNSTEFAVDVYGLYLLMKKISGEIKWESRATTAVLLNEYNTNITHLGTGWDSLDLMYLEMGPCQYAEMIGGHPYAWNSLSFVGHFNTMQNMLNTCISWGQDEEGAIEVLNQMKEAHIIAEARYSHLPDHPIILDKYDWLLNKVVEFFKPVDLRLSVLEFNRIQRRVMGKPLKKELNLDEFPNCPICMDKIDSKQHCTVLNCNHTMHISCAKNWLIKHCIKPTCPCCRACARPDYDISNDSLGSSFDESMARIAEEFTWESGGESADTVIVPGDDELQDLIDDEMSEMPDLIDDEMPVIDESSVISLVRTAIPLMSERQLHFVGALFTGWDALSDVLDVN